MIEIRISGVHDLIAFIRIIRNDNIDELVKMLEKSTDKLLEAERKQGEQNA